MNSFINNLYLHAPVFIQNIGISFFGFFWKKRRFGKEFLPAVEAAKEREFYTLQQWEEYQTLQLRKLLVHAYDTVPFYNEKYTNAGIDRKFLANITLKELPLLPYTTKDEYRQYGTTKMLSSKLHRGDFFLSSGSTGTPVHIYIPDYATQQFNALMEVRVRNWAGVDYTMPRGMVGGRRIIPESRLVPPFYRYNIFEKQTYFSAYHISEKTIGNYMEGIVKNKVEWMTGYAMSNFFIADFLKKIAIKTPKLKAVITSSEKLTQEMRNVIYEVFQCPVYDSYSGCEACGLISESAEGELLVSPDAGIMEFVDMEGNYVSNGEIGEIISTGLINFDQPLIRYRIGDLAKLSKNQMLKTNHHMKKIDEIIGRIEDVVTGKDGRKMVRFHSLFIDIPGLQQSQLIQNSYSDFIIKLIIDKKKYNYEYSERIIRNRLESQLGEVTLDYLYVDTLPTEKNGKIKAVISYVN